MVNREPAPHAVDVLDGFLYTPGIPWSEDIEKNYGAITTAMIEFAKMHVERALLEAAVYGYLREDTFGPEDIKNCYSLDEIK